VAVLALEWVRKRMGVRRDYESLYALGVAFSAFAAAEAVHGSGFLAAFAAGLTITALDVDLCDCFLEYGETTAEMALLLTFVLLGASLIWSGIEVIGFASLAFAALVFLVRPVALLAALARLNLERPARRLIAWFGPRGLSSLLLVLLPVFAGVPGSERLFALCSLVVLLSVVLHGGWPMLLAFRSRRAEAAAAPTLVPAADAIVTAAPPSAPPGPGDVRLSIEQMQAWMARGEPIVVLDVRSERSFAESNMLARGALRVEPVNAALQVRRLGLPQTATLVAFCT
jgi:NhaP-type Na+/H+ or K+/H+ antiporter